MRIEGLLAGIGIVWLAACGGGGRGTAPAAAPLTESETRILTALGEKTAGALAETLVGRLRTALADSGAVGAVEFCSVEAASLTRQVTAERGLTVKRTSSRVRNPQNAPDSLEVEALRHFEAAAGAGPQAGWLQVASAAEVRYYRPLYVLDFCVQCHGSAADLAPGVPEVLAERYPADAATGYRAGDFRGVIRVSMPRGSGR